MYASCLYLMIAALALSMWPPACTAQLQGERIATSDSHSVPAIQDRETAAQRQARLAWWREARFGMFIHWGLYSIPAGTWNGKQIPGVGEWIMNSASIPVTDYKALAGQFNPTGFSAHDIVTLAKAAGMKYIVITAKHHDGFAMFDSRADPFNIVAATPFHRDPLQELALECQRQGIRLGFYYSQDQDWTAPGGAAYKTGDHQAPTFHWDAAQNGDFATYLHTKAIPQLKELLTNYGEFPAVIWFDTPTSDMTPALAAEIVTLLNQHPSLIWNNRLGGGYKGDTETPEQFVPPQGYPGQDWESCMTMNDTWGYKSEDVDFKSTQTLIRNLIDIASKGGNYLLNIGPDATGRVPPAEIERLQEIGKWIAVNGEAIYGTQPTLFGAEAGTFRPASGALIPKDGSPNSKEGALSPKEGALSSGQTNADGKLTFVPAWNWRSTTTANKIYIELFTWPSGAFHLEKPPRKVTGAYLLADKARRPLQITPAPNGIDIALPAAPVDPIATVLVLTTRQQAQAK